MVEMVVDGLSMKEIEMADEMGDVVLMLVDLKEMGPGVVLKEMVGDAVLTQTGVVLKEMEMGSSVDGQYVLTVENRIIGFKPVLNSMGTQRVIPNSKIIQPGGSLIISSLPIMWPHLCPKKTTSQS